MRGTSSHPSQHNEGHSDPVPLSTVGETFMVWSQRMGLFGLREELIRAAEGPQKADFSAG